MDVAALHQRIGALEAMSHTGDKEVCFWCGYLHALRDVLEAENREWKRITPQFDPLPDNDADIT